MKRIGMFCLRWSLRGAAFCMGVVAMFAVVVILATLGAGMFVATAVPDRRSTGGAHDTSRRGRNRMRLPSRWNVEKDKGVQER